jgi:hypothetical protein
MGPEDITSHVSAILNAGYLVRYYARGGRTSLHRLQREQAITYLGLAIREAFNKSDDFKPLLIAVVDALRPRDDPPF